MAATEELIAQEITERVAKQIQDWLGNRDEMSLNFKTDIYVVVLKVLEEGVEF